MRAVWYKLQSAPRRVRWPAKWAILLAVTFLVLYPNPVLFVRHIQHLRRLHTLPDPDDPALASLLEDFDAYLVAQGIDAEDPSGAVQAVEAVQGYVNAVLPYGFDWDVWGVVDYLPTVAEALEKGREDCDGRALVAAALLRACRIDADVVADPQHMWVRARLTEVVDGQPTETTTDTMGPRPEAAFLASSGGLRIRWPQLVNLGPIAVGASRFPFPRELIILVTAWVLLLPAIVDWKRAALGLFLLVTALAMLRLAGRVSRDPSDALVLWGLLHVPVVAVLLGLGAGRTDKHTVRSVL